MTPLQSRALTFIKEYIATHGHSPKYDDICAHLGIKSKSGITRLMDILELRGKIVRSRGSPRSVEVVERRKCPNCGHDLAPTPASPRDSRLTVR
jgi:SOS-response transcriptional repressor LexA